VFFHNATTVTANLFQILVMLLAMYLTYRIKSFLFLFGMVNPYSSSFLGNIQWKIVEQLKNSGFYIIFHKASVTTNLFDFLEILAEICYTYRIMYFPLMLVWLKQIHHHF